MPEDEWAGHGAHAPRFSVFDAVRIATEARVTEKIANRHLQASKGCKIA